MLYFLHESFNCDSSSSNSLSDMTPSRGDDDSSFIHTDLIDTNELIRTQRRRDGVKEAGSISMTLVPRGRGRR